MANAAGIPTPTPILAAIEKLLADACVWFVCGALSDRLFDGLDAFDDTDDTVVHVAKVVGDIDVREDDDIDAGV
jgi:hypothetical protein